MPKVAVLDMTGKEVGTVELSDSIFGIEPNVSVMHDVVVNHLANKRQGTQSALTRAEVSGGGKKPWRQKGTGHARQGSIRSPQWRHGGIVFAPKPRDYSYVVNKKVKRLAMKSAFSSKVLDNGIIVLDSLEMPEYKTKSMVNVLNAIGANGKWRHSAGDSCNGGLLDQCRLGRCYNHLSVAVVSDLRQNRNSCPNF